MPKAKSRCSTNPTRKPRILLTNFRQLEVLTTRLPDVALFAEAPLRYLVFDEAHTYAGATGAEVACLIRRLGKGFPMQPDVGRRCDSRFDFGGAGLDRHRFAEPVRPGEQQRRAPATCLQPVAGRASAGQFSGMSKFFEGMEVPSDAFAARRLCRSTSFLA